MLGGFFEFDKSIAKEGRSVQIPDICYTMDIRVSFHMMRVPAYQVV